MPITDDGMCEHAESLFQYLSENGLIIWGEPDKDGRVNVWCERCHTNQQADLFAKEMLRYYPEALERARIELAKEST